MLFAVRNRSAARRALPDLVVEGTARFRRTTAPHIGRARAPGSAGRRPARGQAARGNPLALLELPSGLTPAELAGGFRPARGPATGGAHRGPLRAAPRGAPGGRPAAIAPGGGRPDKGIARSFGAPRARLGLTDAALEPLAGADLIEIGAQVRFRHPLVRSAVYRAAAPDERRRVRAALAEATDPRVDPDRRAWHLAEATAGPDESVAGELERAAGRAQARGGLAAAAAFLDRAAALTSDPVRRAQRALAAAQTKYEAGALDDALALLVTAETGGVDDLQRARVHLLSAQIAFAVQRGGDAPGLLLKAARELEAVDPERARTAYLEALDAARFAGPLARGADFVEVSKAALAGAAPHRPPRPTDLLLQGIATLPIDGHAAAAPILKAALSAFRDEPDLGPGESRWISAACRAAWDFWDEESWRLLATRELGRARDAGALTAMPLLLSSLSFVHALCGELSSAESLLEELRATTAATGIPVHLYVEIWVAALRGREPELLALVEDFTTDAKARGEGFALAFAGQAAAVLYNGLGPLPGGLRRGA